MTEEERKDIFAEFEDVVQYLRRYRGMIELEANSTSRRILREDAKYLIARFIRLHFREVITFEKDPRFSDAKNIAMAIQPWYPLLGVADSDRPVWDKFFLEMWSLEHGDEPDILKPRSRKQGERLRRSQLAHARLSALEWDVFLRAQGLQPKHYRPEIEVAYAAEWDAIRQWGRKAIPNVIDRNIVEARLSRAARGEEEFLRYPHYHDPLRESGAIYRELMGQPILTLAEFHSRVEQLRRV
jgi:hypothetical protein